MKFQIKPSMCQEGGFQSSVLCFVTRNAKPPQNAKRASRAFVTSLITITIVALLMEFAFSIEAFEAKTARMQSDLFIINYAGYYFDDISYDIRTIAASNLTLRRLDATNTELNLVEPTAAMLFNDSLLLYKQKLANFTHKLNVNATLDISAVSSNSVSYYFSNGMLYTIDYAAGKSDLISSQNGDVTNYTVSFTTTLSRTTLQNFTYSPSGDVYMRISYSDANDTELGEGYLESSPFNDYDVHYQGGSRFWMRIQNSSGNPSSYSMLKDAIYPSLITVSAIIAGNGSEVKATLPITLNVSHLSYSKFGNITVLRG